MSNPRPSRLAVQLGCEAVRLRAATERDYRFDEVRHLMRFGTSPEEIARQVGATRAAISRQAERYDARDIAAYMRPTRHGTCKECGSMCGWSRQRCWDCYRIARGAL